MCASCVWDAGAKFASEAAVLLSKGKVSKPKPHSKPSYVAHSRNDDIDASIKTVRDMASALRLEVDSRRRKVDEVLGALREDLKRLEEKGDSSSANLQSLTEEATAVLSQRLEERLQHCQDLEATLHRHADVHVSMHAKIDGNKDELENQINLVESSLIKQDEDLHREINERVDAVERHHSSISKETAKRLNALDLRIAGLQGNRVAGGQPGGKLFLAPGVQEQQWRPITGVEHIFSEVMMVEDELADQERSGTYHSKSQVPETTVDVGAGPRASGPTLHT
ncbi:Scn11a [Symbiodinium natans]|uniref:Scn11a protein n=1 Tax=Symbiodinium natans TaxID=878477 RepID=A0A812R7X0_9DINO|nr:Scn11a [Symbiodinium natans]